MVSEFIITTPTQLKTLLEEAVSSGLANYQALAIQQQEPDRWFTIEELSNYLPGKPAVSTLYSKVQQRELPHKKIGKRLVFLKSEIDEYLKSQRRTTTQEINSDAIRFPSNPKKRRASWKTR